MKLKLCAPNLFEQLGPVLGTERLITTEAARDSRKKKKKKVMQLVGRDLLIGMNYHLTFFFFFLFSSPTTGTKYSGKNINIKYLHCVSNDAGW